MRPPQISEDRLLWRVLRRISALCDWSWAAWLIALMTAVVCYDTLARYLFSSGSVALQELQWHLFSMVFLLGAAHTMKHNAHVRLDVWSRSRFCNTRLRGWIEVVGNLFLLTPFCLLLIWYGADFSIQAFRHAETSPDPGGLPYRWLLKAAIPVGFSLLLLHALADTVLRCRSLLQDRDSDNK